MRKWNPLLKRWEIPDPFNAALSIEAPHTPVQSAPALAPKIHYDKTRLAHQIRRTKDKYQPSIL